MRDGKLGAGARALILRSCDLLLADAILPTKAFKNYVPRSHDSPIYDFPNLPTSYDGLNDNIITVHAQSSGAVADGASGRPQSAPAARPAPPNASAARPETAPNPSGSVLENYTADEEPRPVETSSPAPASSSTIRRRMLEREVMAKPREWQDNIRHMNTEWSMRSMDHLFNASFTDFVRSDRNCECTGRHLARVVKEFKLDQVVMGLRWLIDGWPIESTAKLLKSVFDDWLPELAGLAIAQIGVAWPLRPKMSLIVAYIMMGEKYTVAALFIKSLTIGWGPSSVTELISCLDTVLEWGDKYFNDFTEVFINELVEGKDNGEVRGQDPEIMIKALATMYKTSVSSTNYRILLADFRLTVAKSNYITHFTHFLTCPQCSRHEPCPITASDPIPNPSAMVRASRNATSDLPLMDESSRPTSASTPRPNSALTSAAAAAAAARAFHPSDLNSPRPVRSHRLEFRDEDDWRRSSLRADEDYDDESTPLRASIASVTSSSSWNSQGESEISTPATVRTDELWRAMVDDGADEVDMDEIMEELEAEDDDDYQEEEDARRIPSMTPPPTAGVATITVPLRPSTSRFSPLPPIPRATSAPAGGDAANTAVALRQSMQATSTSTAARGTRSRMASSNKAASRSASSISFDAKEMETSMERVYGEISRESSGFDPSEASPTPKFVVTPKPPYNVEGAGSETFSNRQLLGAILVAPLALILLLGIPIMYYPLIFVFTALPAFAGYNVFFATMAKPIRAQKGLPGKNIEDYFVIKNPALKAKYNGRKKIPAETWFEAYFDGDIDMKDPKQDMFETLEARYDWMSFVFTLNQAKFFLTQWIPETLWHSKKQDEDQVRDHYDRGDDFYNWFLGPYMVYTSGICKDNTKPESLEQLQQNKLDLVTDKIQLKPGDRMLDIGCGWGTLSVHAAKKGAKVTGVTLGRNQTQWGMKKAADNGVKDNVNILCMDYRDIPKQKFDKITCLEMAEHVGVRKFQEFMRQVRDLLEDDGLFFLQIAGLRRAWQYEDLMWGLFMAKYVFPGADASAPLNWVLEQAERAGFEVLNVDTIGVHYSATIYRWYLNWMKNKDKIIDKYGVRWFRVWEVFLAWSSIIARQGSATCYQIVLHKNLNAFDREKFFSRRLHA
ncbi:hypothetical protein HK101_010104 [Irineochytrium annulatum]|nr:hypothetical protein HK101_010104 [Irineochytrium annulatum]